MGSLVTTCSRCPGPRRAQAPSLAPGESSGRNPGLSRENREEKSTALSGNSPWREAREKANPSRPGLVMPTWTWGQPPDVPLQCRFLGPNSFPDSHSREDEVQEPAFLAIPQALGTVKIPGSGMPCILTPPPPPPMLLTHQPSVPSACRAKPRASACLPGPGPASTPNMTLNVSILCSPTLGGVER